MVGSLDSGNKAVWSAERGAIFLPNIGDKYLRCTNTDKVGNALSNDELAACHDASGHLLLAPEYVAPVRTVPMNVSEDVAARIYVTPQEAYERARLFVLDNPEDHNSTTSWRLVDQELLFNATQLRAGIVRGIDGRELVTDLSVWDGSVVIRFEVFDALNQSSDAVAMKMAPVLTHHHLQKVETLISTEGNSTNPVQQEFIRQLESARQAGGITNKMVLFNQSSEIWAQDFIEPGYANMPGPNGLVAIRVILRSAQSTRTAGRQVFEQLRGSGIGGFQPLSGSGSGFGHREINSFGNLETIPPYTSKSGKRYPAGRIIMGKHFKMLPAAAILDFLHAQQLQSPLILETGWLLIGHVDEFNDGHGGIRAISFEGDTGELEEPGLTDTIDQILSNATFVEANTYAQRYIDANLQMLLAEIPLLAQDIIYVPTLFRDANLGDELRSPDGLPPHTGHIMANERQLMAFHPASINGIVIGSHYFSPKPWGPVINGLDVLARAVEVAYARAGMSLGYVDDFLSHHVGAGEIYCGSNTLRQTDVIWWA
ncbi:Arginine deiminase type-3 [Pyrenophora tritici-repentis]|nr:Arginine deiminase type-3 [Pyrenophora tritici-repentis]KAI2478045.1 Arginine deiminase type-3 [Pyrenophora tritici-repentis]